MLFACFLSAGNSALAKAMMLGVPLFQVLLIRSATAVLACSPFTPFRAFTSLPRPRIQMLRALLSAIEAPMYFFAIAFLPLVDLMTFYMAGPIYVTALSALLLGEKVGWRRWSAVLVGFVGVLIALRPSSPLLTLPSLVALGGSLVYAGMLITTRMVRGTPSIILTITQISAILIVSLVVAPFVWITPTAAQLALIACLGLGTVASTTCINRSLLLAPASVVVPYQYTLIIGGAFFGYLVFGEKPLLTTLIGAAIIVAAGLYIFMRELKVAPKPPVVEAP